MNAPDHDERPALLLQRLIGDDGAPRTERGALGPAFIDFTLGGGRRKAFRYLDLLWIDFYPSGVLILHFPTHSVTLKGRNLLALYVQVLAHEARSVSVTDERYDTGEGSGPVITGIHVWQKSSPREAPPEDDANEPPS